MIESVQKIVKLMRLLEESKKKIAYIAADLGMPESSVYAYVASLKKAKVKIKNQGGMYWIEK